MAKEKRKQAPSPDLLSRLFNDAVLAWRLILDRRVSAAVKLIPVAMIAYILSPIDLIPDFLLPFGVVDDLSALLLGLQLFLRSVPQDVVEEYRRSKRKKNGPFIIEGDYEVTERQDR